MAMAHWVVAQKAILKIEDPKGYQLYFIDVVLSDEPMTDRIGNVSVGWDTVKSFMIDDARAISEFAKEWKGERAEKVHLCWYDFFIYVVRGNRIVDELHVNVKCKQVATKAGTFDFAFEGINDLQPRNSVAVARLAFDTNEARQLMFNKSIKGNCYLSESSQWKSFDPSVIRIFGRSRQAVKSALLP